MGTYVPKGREAEALQVGKNWLVVDADGQVLGRLATAIARAKNLDAANAEAAGRISLGLFFALPTG